MKRRVHDAWCVSALLVGVLLTSLAAASESHNAAADALFRAGRTALATGDLAVACARFADSQRLEPAAGTLLNLADCEEKSGRIAAALAHFVELRESLGAHDFRMPEVNKRMVDLEKRVPQLTVTSTVALPSTAQLVCDGVALGGSLNVAIPFDPGSHVCILHVTGREDARAEIVLREGSRASLTLNPGPVAVAAPERPSSAPRPDVALVDPPSPEKAPPPRRDRTLAYVLGGVGVVGLAAGLTTGILAIRAGNTYRDHCTPWCDSTGVDAAATGRTMVVVSPVALGVGVASLLGAVAVWMFAGRAR